jgi:UDP-N-acetylmuramoyl-tripeptide--D-alanyl-D-alanine ligase
VVKGKGAASRLLLVAKGIGLAVPYVTLTVRRGLDCLYILQLERYDPNRFRSWIQTHRVRLVPGGEVFLQLATAGLAVLIVGFNVAWPLLVLVWLGTGFPSLMRYRPLQVSQSLAWTPRTVRVGIAAGVIALLLFGWMVGLVVNMVKAAPALYALLAGGIGGLAVVCVLMPSIVLWGARLTTPIERLIGRRYLADAAARMARYPGKVLGITGSYGKTSTKYVVADLLAARYRTFKTPAGVNTTMGITRVIREDLSDEQEIFVVEMSAYGPGEIREVCDLVHPAIGILTAVGVQHLERFGTPERIAEAKYELIAALPAGGPAIMNADDPTCRLLAERARAEGKRVRLYGFDAAVPDLFVAGSDVTVSPQGSRFRVRLASGETAHFETTLLGRWNLSNVLAGIAAGVECGIPLGDLAEPVKTLRPAPRRLEIHTEGGITRILDVANANPRGAAMALEVLSQFTGGSRILITPGMVELGPIEAEENRKFGEQAAAVCDYVILVGPEQTRPIAEGLRARQFPAERLLVARHADEVADLLAPIVRPGDVLLYENRLPDTYFEGA